MKRRSLLKAALAAPLALLFGKKAKAEKPLTATEILKSRGMDKSDYNYVRQCSLCHHLCFTKDPEEPICPHCQDRSGAMYVYYPYAYFYRIDNDGKLHVEYCEK